VCQRTKEGIFPSRPSRGPSASGHRRPPDVFALFLQEKAKPGWMNLVLAIQVVWMSNQIYPHQVFSLESLLLAHHLARFKLCPFLGFSSFTTEIVWICCAKNSCVPCLDATGHQRNHLIMKTGDPPHPENPHDHLRISPASGLSPLRTLSRSDGPKISLRDQ